MFQWNYEDPLGLVDGEPGKANQALQDYAKLGPDRSLSKLCERYRSGIETGSPTRRIGTLRDWSVAYSWVARVATYEDQLRAAERAAMLAKRTKRAELLADRSWETAEKLFKQAGAMLDWPIAKVEQVTKTTTSKDGRTTIINMNVVQPARWTFHSAAVVADIASKIGALAAGEATDRRSVTIENLTKKNLEDMSLEELLALRAQLGD